MFGKINKYVVLKADFNCKLMFGKINFILPNIYFTKVYSTSTSWICDYNNTWKLLKKSDLRIQVYSHLPFDNHELFSCSKEKTSAGFIRCFFGSKLNLSIRILFASATDILWTSFKCRFMLPKLGNFLSQSTQGFSVSSARLHFSWTFLTWAFTFCSDWNALPQVLQ